jgi:enoyl-CoA hydratase
MIRLDVAEGIGWITLDRPPVNALDEAMVAQLDRIVSEIEAEHSVRAVVVRSDGTVFCAGADIRMLASFLESGDGPGRLTAYAAHLQRVLARIAALPIATIAEVGGAATGGGLELALACDIRIASDRARAGLTEANIGLVPGAGGTQRLASVAGRSRALLTLLGGELLDARRALDVGVFDEVVTSDELTGRVADLASTIAGRSREVVVEVKRCVTGASDGSGFHAELHATERLASLPETRELMDRFFTRKEPAT